MFGQRGHSGLAASRRLAAPHLRGECKPRRDLDGGLPRVPLERLGQFERHRAREVAEVGPGGVLHDELRCLDAVECANAIPDGGFDLILNGDRHARRNPVVRAGGGL